MLRILVWALLAATVLAACETPPAPTAGASALTTVFNCGGRRAAVTTTPETARVQVDNQSFDMKLSRSASGARYEAVGDATTIFWNKGERATLTVRGRDYPECVQQKIALPLRATGNEPSWLLEAATSSLTLTTDFGARRVVTGPPVVTREADATVFSGRAATGEVAAAVVDRVCNDTMSGMPHPYSVTVRDGGRTLRGCGGDPAALLRAREWIVEDIDVRGIIDNSRLTLAFDDTGRISGSGGCNNYAGRYTLSGEGLQIREVAATRKACSPALMQQEARFIAALGATQRFEITAEGALRLLGGDKRSILAR